MTTHKDPLVQFENFAKDMPRAQLGGLVKEYFAESNHNGWDGHDRRHLTGVRALVADMMLYFEHHDDRDGLATKMNNINRVP